MGVKKGPYNRKHIEEGIINEYLEEIEKMPKAKGKSRPLKARKWKGALHHSYIQDFERKLKKGEIKVTYNPKNKEEMDGGE